MRQRIRLVAGAISLAATGVFTVLPAAADAVSATPAASRIAGAGVAHSCQVALPGGIEMEVDEQNGVETPLLLSSAYKGTIAQFSDDGDTIVVPAAAMRSASTTDYASYDITRLAAQHCGLVAGDDVGGMTAETAATGQDSARTGVKSGARYALGLLTIHALDMSGKPAVDDQIALSNMDDTGEANEFLDTDSNGMLQVMVPVGHYDLLLSAGDGSPWGAMVLDSDVSVTNGTSVTLDERTATVTLPVPTTPRPADLASSSLSLGANAGGGYGAAYSSLLSLFDDGSTPPDFHINPTGAQKYGEFSISAGFEFVSPPGYKPYSYHISEAYNHVPDAFPTTVQASSLATVTREYGAPGQPGTAWEWEDSSPAWMVKTGTVQMPDVNWNLPTGQSRTEYFSAAPGQIWNTFIFDLAFGTESEGENAYLPGASSTELFDMGGSHPSVPRDVGGGALCGACSNNTELQFSIPLFGDNSPGHTGFNIGGPESDSLAIYRDGALYADGNTSLDGAVVSVPTGPATYKVEQTTTRDVSGLSMATGSQTTWTFTTDPGHGRAIPSGWVCTDYTNACSTLPLLFAYYNTDADLLNQLTVGRHTLDLTVQHQQDSDAPAVAGAQISVSYDGGSTWQSLDTTGHRGSYRATFIVPASAEGDYVSLRISAWDGAGNRIDQTVTSAYQVD